MIALFGSADEAYCVTTRRAVPHVDDTTSILVKFKNGVTGSIFCSLSTAPAYSFAVYGSKGVAEISKPSLETFTFQPAPPRPREPAGPMETVETKGFDTLQAELAAFAAAARGKAPFPVPLDEVLMGVQGFEAVVRSSKEGRPVKVA